MLLLSSIVKNIEILYEDDSVIVVNKPAGLAVQGGKGVKSSLDKILACVRTPAPLLVHRLDKDTSGILLAAKTRDAAGRFSRAFGSFNSASNAGSRAVKQYIAICVGCPDSVSGIISQELSVHGRMKKSETKYKVIKSGQIQLKNSKIEYSILELELGTGRMHQIRRHLAMTGNPVLGDDKYGDFQLNKKLRKETGLKRLLLHASHLVIKECAIDIHAPLPDYFNIRRCFADADMCH